MNIETLKKEFSARANEEKANHLVGYMRNQFLFYGLQTPERRAIYHNFLKDEVKIDYILFTIFKKYLLEMKTFD